MLLHGVKCEDKKVYVQFRVMVNASILGYVDIVFLNIG